MTNPLRVSSFSGMQTLNILVIALLTWSRKFLPDKHRSLIPPYPPLYYPHLLPIYHACPLLFIISGENTKTFPIPPFIRRLSATLHSVNFLRSICPSITCHFPQLTIHAFWLSFVFTIFPRNHRNFRDTLTHSSTIRQSFYPFVIGHCMARLFDTRFIPGWSVTFTISRQRNEWQYTSAYWFSSRKEKNFKT